MLYPTYTASGGVSDMVYRNNGVLYAIETTIHSTLTQTINSEVYPCCNHLRSKYDRTVDSEAKLLFVSFFNNDIDLKQIFEADFYLMLSAIELKKLYLLDFMIFGKSMEEIMQMEISHSIDILKSIIQKL
jgi:hypothetical protein